MARDGSKRGAAGVPCRGVMTLPEYTRVPRELPLGEHAYCDVLPGIRQSPALRRIVADRPSQRDLLRHAFVSIRGVPHFAFIDISVPCIVLGARYYRRGRPRDLYLDLLHELTHLRQLAEGCDLWDDRYEYVDRPTEIEGYAVAVEEGRRLGMTDHEIVRHLSNPWMTEADVQRLTLNVERFLARHPLP